MKRLYFYVLIFGFSYGGINSVYAEPSLILSNSSDIQVIATVISPVGFVSIRSDKEEPAAGRAFDINLSHEISVLTSGNIVLEIENGQRKFFLISSENSGCFTFNNNLLWSDMTPRISVKSAELLGETTTDSRLCLVTLITISD